MQVKDRTNESYPGTVVQHGTQHLKTSDMSVAAAPGSISGDGGYDGFAPKTPEPIETASDDLSPKEGHVPCESGPMPVQGGEGANKAVVANLDKMASVGSHPQLMAAHRHSSNIPKKTVGQNISTVGQPASAGSTMPEPVTARPDGKPITAR